MEAEEMKVIRVFKYMRQLGMDRGEALRWALSNLIARRS